MRKTAHSKSGVGFDLTNSPLSTVKVLIDAVGYVCLESVKCDNGICQALGDLLTLSLSETLNKDSLITPSIFVIHSQNLTRIIKQYNHICYD